MLHAFRVLAPDWPETVGAGFRTSLHVRSIDDGWRIDGADHVDPGQPYGEIYEVANGLIGCLTACYLANEPDILCLHAAAVQTPSGLIALLGPNFTGKSTLAVALAAQGWPLFCDDRLLVSWRPQPEGRSLGIATKLRLPLPEDADAGLRAFVERHAAWDAARFAILDGPGAARARFAAQGRLAAFILLQRHEDATKPDLERLSRPDAVRALLQQHFAPQLTTAELLTACADVARIVPAWQFRYSGCSSAATVLRGALEQELSG